MALVSRMLYPVVAGVEGSGGASGGRSSLPTSPMVEEPQIFSVDAVASQVASPVQVLQGDLNVQDVSPAAAEPLSELDLLVQYADAALGLRPAPAISLATAMAPVESQEALDGDAAQRLMAEQSFILDIGVTPEPESSTRDMADLPVQIELSADMVSVGEELARCILPSISDSAATGLDPMPTRLLVDRVSLEHMREIEEALSGVSQKNAKPEDLVGDLMGALQHQPKVAPAQDSDDGIQARVKGLLAEFADLE